jgi:hypothetical protein
VMASHTANEHLDRRDWVGNAPGDGLGERL